MARHLTSPSTNGTSWEQHTLATDAPVIGKVLDDPPAHLAAGDVMRLPMVNAEAGRFGPLWVQAGSIAGRSHLGGPEPSSGQDSYCSLLSADGSTAVFAIADGLGSRRRSHVGASTATRAACRTFAQPWARALLDGPTGAQHPTDEVLTALRAIETEVLAVEAAGREGKDVATTLLVAVVDCQPELRRAYFVRIGDPDALLLPDGRFHPRSLVFGADESAAANALHACIPMKDPATEVEFVRVGHLAADVVIGLVTDGIGNDVRASQMLRTWFEDSWAYTLDANAMLDTLRYRRQGSSDDRTALVIHLHPPFDSAASPLSLSPERPPARSNTPSQEPARAVTAPTDTMRRAPTDRSLTLGADVDARPWAVLAVAALLALVCTTAAVRLIRSSGTGTSSAWVLEQGPPSGGIRPDGLHGSDTPVVTISDKRVIAVVERDGTQMKIDDCLRVWKQRKGGGYDIVHKVSDCKIESALVSQVFLRKDLLYVVRANSLTTVSLTTGRVDAEPTTTAVGPP